MVLDIGQPVSQNGGLYWYQSHFPNTCPGVHTLLGVWFAQVNAPGYTQIFKWNDTIWISAGGTDYLDMLNPTDIYGMWLSTPSGWTTPYDCAVIAPVDAYNWNATGQMFRND